jgi:PilZ domain
LAYARHLGILRVHRGEEAIVLDRRKEQRSPTYLGGTLSFNKRLSTADCLVRNTSPSGAKIALPNTRFVPDEFDLVIPQWHAEYRMRVVWRRQDQLGIEVVPSDLNEEPTQVAQARRLKRLERDNKELRLRLSLSHLD